MNLMDVKGYEDHYEISSCGKIFSKERIINNRLLQRKELKLNNNGKGHFKAFLSSNGKRKGFYIHRLVWEHFKGEIPEGYEVDHNDCDKTNNCITNLQLLTRKENMIKCHIDYPHLKQNLINCQV